MLPTIRSFVIEFNSNLTKARDFAGEGSIVAAKLEIVKNLKAKLEQGELTASEFFSDVKLDAWSRLLENDIIKQLKQEGFIVESTPEADGLTVTMRKSPSQLFQDARGKALKEMSHQGYIDTECLYQRTLDIAGEETVNALVNEVINHLMSRVSCERRFSSNDQGPYFLEILPKLTEILRMKNCFVSREVRYSGIWLKFTRGPC